MKRRRGTGTAALSKRQRNQIMPDARHRTRLALAARVWQVVCLLFHSGLRSGTAPIENGQSIRVLCPYQIAMSRRQLRAEREAKNMGSRRWNPVLMSCPAQVGIKPIPHQPCKPARTASFRVVVGRPIRRPRSPLSVYSSPVWALVSASASFSASGAGTPNPLNISA